MKTVYVDYYVTVGGRIALVVDDNATAEEINSKLQECSEQELFDNIDQIPEVSLTNINAETGEYEDQL